MTHIARAALQVLDLFLPHIMVFVWLIPNILIYLWIPVSVLLYWKIWDVVYIPEQYFTCLDVLLLSGLSVYSVTVFLLLECFCWTPPSLHSSSFYFPDRNFWIKLLYIGMFLLTRQKKKNISQKPVVVAEVLRKHQQGCDEKFPFSWLSPQEITGDLRTVLPSCQKWNWTF